MKKNNILHIHWFPYLHLHPGSRSVVSIAADHLGRAYDILDGSEGWLAALNGLAVIALSSY